uniref:Sugar phosphate transporter domain-containing protein n=1 Tax=Neospora caninum (strain Liverpool) TaxID=572307 RepID=F0JB12_NEOCL|nr:hypothetical protein NCLIV_069350 [Neospora caninum Liverpool]CEL71278.1 TPA: hypothetical protein BN1204_069350 [Neospora caninum Liverpool]
MKRHAKARGDGGLSASATQGPLSKEASLSSRFSFPSFCPSFSVQSNPQTFTCVCACAVYMAASLATVFLNHKLLSDLFPFPLTLSWLQEVVGVAMYLLLSAVGRASRSVAEETRPHRSSLARQSSVFLRRTLTASLRSPAAASLGTFFPHTSADARTLSRVLPLSLAFVCMVGFSNTCLKHVQVSTYQVARSLTLLFNMVLQRILLDIRVPLGAALSCGVVCVGFLIGSLDASTLSLAGALTGAVSSLFQAVYTVHIRKTLDSLGGAHAAVMFYNMVNASFLFPPLIWATGEWGDLSSFVLPASEGQDTLPGTSTLEDASRADAAANSPGGPEGNLSLSGAGLAGSLLATLFGQGGRGFYQSPFWIFVLIVASGTRGGEETPEGIVRGGHRHVPSVVHVQARSARCVLCVCVCAKRRV